MNATDPFGPGPSAAPQLNGTAQLDATQSPANESISAPGPEPVAPSPPPFLQFPDQDQFVSSCANSDSPICYNTSISGANIITNLWFSAILGLLCYLAFVMFRTKFRLYQARLHMPTVTHKPPQLKLSAWHHRWWSWVVPVFRVSDEELLKSAGMDALIAVKILYFGILCFLPITLAAMAILIPINYTDDYYSSTAQADGLSDTYSTVFIRLTMSNIRPGSSVLWVHFCFVYGAVFWTCWLITEFYKEYISLRQAYVIRNTEAANAHIGGSAEAFEQEKQPIITSRGSERRSSFRSSINSLADLDGSGKHLGATPDAARSQRRTSLDFINEVRDASLMSHLNTPLRILHAEGAPRKDSIGVLTNRSVSFSGRSVYETPYNARPGYGDGAGSGSNSNSPSKSPATSISGYSGLYAQEGCSDRDGEFDVDDHLDTETDNESVVERHVTISERWTDHDFSQDVGVGLAGPSSDRGPRPGSTQTAGGRRSPLKHRSGSAAAAVAIALDTGHDSTAASALAKIRHHRAASGASYASSLSNHTGTPHGSPRQRSPRQGGGMSGMNAFDEATSMERIPERVFEGIPGEADHTTADHNTAAAATNPGKPPRGLVQIITTVAEDSERDGNMHVDDLPTAMALDPAMCDPEGQQGIGHRWWSYMIEAGSGRLRTDHGKGFVQSDMRVRTAPPDAPGVCDPDRPEDDCVTVNASLYTVLVTDEPIEKLHLKKPFRKTKLTNANLPGRKKTGGGASRKSKQVGKANTADTADEQGDGSGKSSLRSLASLDDIDIDAIIASAPSDDPTHVIDATSPLSRGLDLSERGLTGTELALERGSVTTATKRKESFHFHFRKTDPKTDSRELLTDAAKAREMVREKEAEKEQERQSHASAMASMNVSERGMGLTSGWSATITNLMQWWKNRGGYKEWRRDVRWAMFRKRARIATQMFTELFGEDFDSLVPIYPTQSVDKLIVAWDKKCAKLERAQYDIKSLVKKEEARLGQVAGAGESQVVFDKKLERYRKKIAILKGRIIQLKEEATQLQDQIVEERERVLSGLPSTCFFATFKSQEAAAIAAQANLNPIQQRLLNVQAAPSPDDVNWPSLTRSWWQRQSRPIIVLPLILFIMLLPIGAFSGAFAQLTIAVCGSPADTSKPPNDSWYCSDDPWANFFRNLVTSLAPTLLLSLYHMCILPVLVYYAAQAEGQQFSLSGLDRRCCSLFFYWDVFNVFLGAMLGGSVIAELPTYIEDPAQIWSALSAAIPSSSNFFINYVAYRALVMAWFRLWYPHMGTTVSALKWMRILPWAKSPREKALESPIRNCRYGRDVGIPVLMNFVMVLAYCVVSPLILPFGLLYFMLLWMVWRYQMLYVYQRSYESGGQFWPLVAHRVVACLFICVLFTSTVLILKEAYTQAVLMLCSLPLYLLRFDIYLNSRYDGVVEQIPLMAVHKAGRVDSVDPDLWTPAPLREGAQGWHPQWGVVWQYWGVPRYSL